MDAHHEQSGPAAPAVEGTAVQQGHSAWQDYQSVFTAAKAGMEGVDKDKVKRIVYEMSKDSAHFKNEQRKQAQVDQKIQQLQAQAAALLPADLAHHRKAATAKIAALEAGRDLTRTWLHIDMDAFYAAVEQRERPALEAVPMAVGGLGMICTANYEARKYGVRSAMPGFIARKLCPQLVFCKPDFNKYTAASEETRAVFRCYDPQFEAGSLDEAYLDVTDYCREHGVTGAQVAGLIRDRMREEVRLTCSAGLAPNKRLAKVCSDLHKPDGQYVLPPSRDAVMAFISSLPIRKVPGIGKVSEQTLTALGVTRCGHLLQHAGLLAALFSPVSQEFFWEVGLGLGTTRHPAAPAAGQVTRKGISCERTFANMRDPVELQGMLSRLTEHLAADMAAENLSCRTLTLKLKTSAFELRTRASSLPTYIHTPSDMLPVVTKLLQAELPIEVRLMGVRASNLQKRGARGNSNALLRLLGKVPGGGSTAGGSSANAVHPAAAEEPQAAAAADEQDPGLLQLLCDGMQQQQQQQQHGPAAYGNADPEQPGGCRAEGMVLTQQQLLGEELLSLEDEEEQQPVQDMDIPGLHDGCRQDEDMMDAEGFVQQQLVAVDAGGGQDQYPQYHHHPHQHQQQQQQQQQQQAGSSTRPSPSVAAQSAASASALGAATGATSITDSSANARLQPCAVAAAPPWDAATAGPLPAAAPAAIVPGDLQQQPQQPSASRQSSGLGRGVQPKSSSWVCSTCTYAGNPTQLLRCEVCDTPKSGPLSFQPLAGSHKQQAQHNTGRRRQSGSGTAAQQQKRARVLQQQGLVEAFGQGRVKDS